MRVEHKTENGVILFVDVPAFTISFSLENLWCDFVRFKSNNSHQDVIIKKGKWQLIGLTSEVTEEQAKMMVDSDEGFYQDYVMVCDRYYDPVESFKSLMQHLQVYEVNPYGGICSVTYDFNRSLWQEAQERTGKRVVLFKPTEK